MGESKSVFSMYYRINKNIKPFRFYFLIWSPTYRIVKLCAEGFNLIKCKI